MTPLKHAALTCALAALLLVAAAPAVEASEIYALGGAIASHNPSDESYSWQLEYRQDLLKHLAGGVSYLNEGHFKGHHRDGYTAQLWTRAELLDYRLTVAAGIGPYFFLDTTAANSPTGFTDDHGWKGMVSGAATWHFDNNVLFEIRSNWVTGSHRFNTVSALAGIGYHFEPTLEPLNPHGTPPEERLKNEVSLLLGRTIVNSFNSEHSLAGAIEYRRWLSRHFDWTVTGLYEGDTRLVRRDGVMTQLWLTQELVDDKFSVGAGAGAYFNLSRYHHASQPPGTDRILSGIFSLTGSYRFTPHWSARVSWNRVITSYERDTDVLLGGMGYRF